MKPLLITFILLFPMISKSQEPPCKKKYINQRCAVKYAEDSKGNPHGTYIEYSENGTVIRRGTYKNGIKTGSWYDSSDGSLLFFGGIYQWYENGNFVVGSFQEIKTLAEANKLKAQKLDANKETETITISGKQYKAEYQLNNWGNCYINAYKLFYLSGKPYKVSNFKDCQENGNYFMYYENGKLMEKGNYSYGKKDGIVEAYYEDGKPRLKANFKADKENGLWEQFWPNGKPKLRYNYVDGLLNGISEDYYDNGILLHRMNYSNDLEDGVQEIYNASGKLEKLEKISYEMGWQFPVKKTVYTEEYFSNGSIKAKETIVHDLKTNQEFKDGTWEFYNESGVLINQNIYSMQPK